MVATVPGDKYPTVRHGGLAGTDKDFYCPQGR